MPLDSPFRRRSEGAGRGCGHLEGHEGFRIFGQTATNMQAVQLQLVCTLASDRINTKDQLTAPGSWLLLLIALMDGQKGRTHRCSQVQSGQTSPQSYRYRVSIIKTHELHVDDFCLF